jgi:hypothetical protein
MTYREALRLAEATLDKRSRDSGVSPPAKWELNLKR